VAHADATARSRVAGMSRFALTEQVPWVTCLLVCATASCGGEFSCADEKTCVGHGVTAGSGNGGGSGANTSATNAGTGGDLGGNAGDPNGGGAMAGGGRGGAGGAGGDGGSGGVPPPRLFVDAVNGSDEANPVCAEAAPCRTLSHTLPLAKSGYFVELEPGTYDATIGEDFAEPVPDGVTLEAVKAASVTLRGDAARTKTALTFAGSGTARDLTLDSFALGVAASTGTVALERITVTGCGTGLLVEDQADVTLTNGAISATDLGFSLIDFARLSIDGGTISGTGTGTTCGQGTVGSVTVEADLRLSKVTASGNWGGLYLGGNSTANIADSTFSNNGIMCEADYHIIMAEAPSLTMSNTVITGGWGGLRLAGDVTLSGGRIYGIGVIGGDAIFVEGGSVSIDGTAVAGKGDHSGLGLNVAHGAVDVRNATFSQWSEGISIWPKATLRVRNTELSANDSGVCLFDQQSSCDLGTTLEPGGNTIRGNTRGLDVYRMSGDQTAAWFIQASGNTWDPSVQGSDAEGHMRAGSVLAGPYTEPGTNFRLDSSLVAVHF
jgi:hypothetical protein